MILTSSAALGQQRRRHLRLPDGFEYYKSEWMECGQDPVLSPTVFLVEQVPGAHLVTHFHGQNQFQVFVDGSGTIGPHALGPVTVHYAGAYTGYGPIVAGPKGLAYFTIRSVFEQGAMVLPEKRGMLRRGPKRQFHTEPIAPASDGELASLGAVRVDDLVADQPDHIAVRRVRLPPGAQSTGLDPSPGWGQFSLVIGGALEHAGARLGRWESLFASPDEAAPLLRAGPAGADVLCLRPAAQDPAYR
jgi:hypothetical protein